MPKRYFSRGQSTYICHVCHKETRDTGRGEGGAEGTGLCYLCFELAGYENLHSDEDHDGEFHLCPTCTSEFTPAMTAHLPYFTGEKSYPTI